MSHARGGANGPMNATESIDYIYCTPSFSINDIAAQDHAIGMPCTKHNREATPDDVLLNNEHNTVF